VILDLNGQDAEVGSRIRRGRGQGIRSTGCGGPARRGQRRPEQEAKYASKERPRAHPRFH
jgi:hypothetical protein